MRLDCDALELAATDLSNFLSCQHRTRLELEVARGERAKPAWVDPSVELLRKRGQEHESR